MSELKKHSTKELAIAPIDPATGANPLQMSRLLGAATLLVNLFLLVLAIWGLISSNAASQSPLLLPAFAIIFVIYAIFSTLLIVFLTRAFGRVSQYQGSLQTLLTNYERR